VAVWELLPWSSCVRHLEGQADRRPAVAKRRAWWPGVVASCRPVLPQRWGWRCSASDGSVVAGMAAQD
jgi:hypothetical protein